MRIDMGRSVSYATGSIAKVYYDVSSHGYPVDDDGNQTGEYNQDIAQWDWEDFKEGIRHDIETLWPSFTPCDEWVGREDKAIMENTFAYIGLSEYCGCACLWLVPKESDGYYAEDIRRDNLARGFCSRIQAKFSEKFGEFVRIGGFSNGESVYQRKEEKKAG
jgi:hypothetical protein